MSTPVTWLSMHTTCNAKLRSLDMRRASVFCRPVRLETLAGFGAGGLPTQL